MDKDLISWTSNLMSSVGTKSKQFYKNKSHKGLLKTFKIFMKVQMNFEVIKCYKNN